jgi:hypothetical protein
LVPNLCAAALLLLGTAIAGLGLEEALSRRVALRFVLGRIFWVEVAALAVSVALGAVAAVLEIRDLRDLKKRAGGRPLRSTGGALFAPVRGAFVLLVAWWWLFLVFVQPFQRLWFDMAAGMAAGIFALGMLIARWLARPPARAWRVVDLVATSLCLLVVSGELGLRTWAAWQPSALVGRVGDAPRRLLERFRCAPGLVRFGFPCNDGGYYDTAFHRRREGEHLVVSIGDSFSVGSVPHAAHFTTLCEERLGAPVHNFGAAGIGPPEYLHLLVEEALPLDPDVVVLGVFVGNDLTFAQVEEGLPDSGLRDWLQRDRVLLWVVPERLSRIADESDRQAERPGPAAAVQGASVGDALDDGEPLESRFPWLADPALEEPTLSEPAHLRLETRRALDNCRADPVAFGGFCEAVLEARRAAGETPVLVMLIPDEFQVEDELWRAVLEEAGEPLDRDRPQRLVSGWLGLQGIPCLDLLPVMRAVEPLEDGRRHLYHLRDTHFNARGNRLVADALSAFVEPWIGR